MHNMQVLCPYYVKDHMKAKFCMDRCVVLSLKFELSESILEQMILIIISYIFTVILL